MRAIVFACVVALAASGAFAQMLADFETANPFSGGTIVADPTDPTNNVLLVSGQQISLDLAQPLAPGEGVSIDVFDKGTSFYDGDENTGGNQYGWNIGIAGTYNFGVSFQNRTYLGSNAGYAWVGQYYDSWPQTATAIYSQAWFGGPRQVESLATIGEGTAANPDVPGVGAWSTWTYTFNPDGSITIGNSGTGTERTTDPVETGITRVFAASVAGPTGEVWIDNVQIVTGVVDCIPGDANCDGVVDLDDFVILKNNFGATAATWDMGDFNADGVVDLDDFVILKNNFGATAAVPEPATLSLLALSGLALIRRRRP